MIGILTTATVLTSVHSSSPGLGLQVQPNSNNITVRIDPFLGIFLRVTLIYGQRIRPFRCHFTRNFGSLKEFSHIWKLIFQADLS